MATGYVREARPAEAEEIARIQLSTWRTAYRRLLPEQVLAALDQEWMTRRWREAIESPPDPRHHVLVAVEQVERPGADRPVRSTLVGFAAIGPAVGGPEDSAEDFPDGITGAVTDLLVEPRWGRRGHGSRLLAASVDMWRADGFTRAIAWVFEADRATRSFLTSAGWRPDGAARSLDVDDLLIPQLRMHTVLS